MSSETSLKKEIDSILQTVAIQENLEKDFKKGSFYKWEELRNSWFKSSQKYSQVKNVLFGIQIALGVIPLILTTIMDGIEKKWIAISVWIVYAAIVLLINYLYKNFPDEYEKALKDIKIIKLVSMSEKLATQLALLNKTTNINFEEDENKIKKLSTKVKDFKEINNEIQSVINKCAQKNYRASDSRDTSVVFKKDDINLTSVETDALNKITLEICEIAQILFGGKGYTSKLYLKVVKDIEYNTNSEEQTEILISFSRFPTKNDFGTSWVKSRGKASKVWECLEKGESDVYSFLGESLYYESILSICLPGRIGVLNIQSENVENFKDKDIEINSKVISLYALERIEKTLGLN